MKGEANNYMVEVVGEGSPRPPEDSRTMTRDVVILQILSIVY